MGGETDVLNVRNRHINCYINQITKVLLMLKWIDLSVKIKDFLISQVSLLFQSQVRAMHSFLNLNCRKFVALELILRKLFT